MSAFLYLLAASAAVGAFGWYVITVPGESHRGALAPLSAEESASSNRLRKHMTSVASTEHNTRTPERLEAAAVYIEAELKSLGYEVRVQGFDSGQGMVRNLEVVLAGREKGSLVIGAHYDSAPGAPGVVAGMDRMFRALDERR